MSIPVRYWDLPVTDFAMGDVFNTSNFMFWHPGPSRHYPNAHPKGWASHTKDPDKSYALVPHANRSLIRGSGVKPFLQRRALQLPRQGGFFLVWVKTSEPVPGHAYHAFSMGLAHFRHCGPSAPLGEFITRDELPEVIRKWFPTELG